jgi:hypothetical protein
VDDSKNTGMLSERVPPEKIKKIIKKHFGLELFEQTPSS